MLGANQGGIFFHKPSDIGINPNCQEVFYVPKQKSAKAQEGRNYTGAGRLLHPHLRAIDEAQQIRMERMQAKVICGTGEKRGALDLSG